MSRPKSPRGHGQPDLAATIRAWEPSGWEELVAVWDELVPEAKHPDIAIPNRQFRSMAITNQQAGLVFERWIIAAFKASGADVEYPYTVSIDQKPGGRIAEEHDGLLFDGWQGFLIQSKFYPQTAVSFGPIAELKGHVESRPIMTMGLLFSAFHISAPALGSSFPGNRRPRCDVA